MKHSQGFWLVVSVRFFHPVKDIEPGLTAPGYYIAFGATALSEAMARTLVERAVTDGHILWDDSQVSTEMELGMQARESSTQRGPDRAITWASDALAHEPNQ